MPSYSTTVFFVLVRAKGLEAVVPVQLLSTALADIISMLFLDPGVAIPTGIRCSKGFRKTCHSEMQFMRSKSYVSYGGSVIFPTSFGDPESKRPKTTQDLPPKNQFYHQKHGENKSASAALKTIPCHPRTL